MKMSHHGISNLDFIESALPRERLAYFPCSKLCGSFIREQWTKEDYDRFLTLMIPCRFIDPKQTQDLIESVSAYFLDAPGLYE